MSRLSRLAHGLRELGLTIEEYPPGARDPRELRVTNPRFPSRGQIVIDRDGLIEWTLLTDITTDSGTSAAASVISGLLSESEGGGEGGNGAAPRLREVRPHP